ncbi:porin family protein [Cytophaga aurantiaca]|uniref:porin family protein n=1 Tax=Cytophaga aurantiaca TaxID=29530 RepID=UPI000379B90B|nr:porin family protein [Cytophaga aurantiaca]
MKKIILLALIVATSLSAKNSMAQISVGPKVGLNLAHIYSDGDLGFDNPSNKVGFQIGGMLNAQINDYFAIRPELLFNNVGSKFKSNSSDATATITTNYLSLPLNFIGQYPINDKFKIQAFAGPYAALGLGGKYKVESPFGNTDGSIKMKKDPGTSSDLYLNSMDFGLNFGLGFQYTSFVFTANYGLGLTNLEPHYKDSAYEDTRGENGKLYNRNITFGVAYLFGGK